MDGAEVDEPIAGPALAPSGSRESAGHHQRHVGAATPQLAHRSEREVAPHPGPPRAEVEHEPRRKLVPGTEEIEIRRLTHQREARIEGVRHDVDPVEGVGRASAQPRRGALAHRHQPPRASRGPVPREPEVERLAEGMARGVLDHVEVVDGQQIWPIEARHRETREDVHQVGGRVRERSAEARVPEGGPAGRARHAGEAQPRQAGGPRRRSARSGEDQLDILHVRRRERARGDPREPSDATRLDTPGLDDHHHPRPRGAARAPPALVTPIA